MICQTFCPWYFRDVQQMADEQTTPNPDSDDSVVGEDAASGGVKLQFSDVVETAKQLTTKVHRTSSFQDEILKIQQILKLP